LSWHWLELLLTIGGIRDVYDFNVADMLTFMGARNSNAGAKSS
jgi:hypothetical protein